MASWGLGLATTVAVVVTATVMYGWHAYLRTRLPAAVHWQELFTQIGELEGRTKLAQAELDRLQNEIQQRWQESNSLQAEIGSAKDWLEKNEERVRQLPAMQSEIEATENKLREARAALEQLENDTLQAKANRLEEEERTNRACLLTETLRQQQADLAQQKQQLEDHLVVLRGQQQELQVQLGKLELDCRNAEAELNRRLQEANRESDRLAGIQRELEGRLAQVRNELEEARRALNEAQEQSRVAETRREQAAARLEVTESEISEKKSLLKNLEQMLQGLSKRVEDFQLAIEPPKVEKRMADLLRSVLELPDTAEALTATGVDAEKRQLQVCQEHFRKNGFEFHERTLRAFHTSLKTADISPLVVLAGISGTGKSQLPRLYAEAMGMHFLNVAVQPRWDAPQDLFGFYNYMEHSYKATELARALWQMDSQNCNGRLHEGNRRISEGMLLVLLDEMNLARVEYYFSELLSKLEMRNALGSGESQNRQLAGIEIELGPLARGEVTRRLYVGSNVLFIGTMNEDESTQALSDKVMDRSNILRFGKPGTLKREMPERSPPPERYLEQQDWRSWVQDQASDEEQSQFDEVCKKLNDALSTIQRPFGHRVHKAMYRYLVNYPKWVDDRFNNAMADQIEQKIIPRLRGLSSDTDDRASHVFEEIRQVISGLQDEALTDAYEEACKRPVFQWMGVNREPA